MQNLEIQKIKELVIPILKSKGVLRSSLFGSFARGEAGSESDIDILVELPDDRSLLDLADIQITLEDSLGKKFDVITYNSLNPLLRDRILADQVSIL